MGTLEKSGSEEDRLRAACLGDPDAFASIFDLHRDRVFRHALRLVRSPQDAEDVTALVFLELWRRRTQVRIVEGSVLAWLLVTTNYVVRNHIRTLNRHRIAMAKLPRPTETVDHADEVLGTIDNAIRARSLQAAFSHLSQPDQDVLTLCVLEELSVAAASRALSIPAGTVKSRLSRAKQRLASGVATTLSDNGQPAFERSTL